MRLIGLLGGIWNIFGLMLYSYREIGSLNMDV